MIHILRLFRSPILFSFFPSFIHSSMTEEDSDIIRCNVNGAVSWISQIALFTLAFFAVLYKRHLEHPKRSFAVWWFDVLKQTVGSIIQHFSCFFLAMFQESQEATTDGCFWFLTNFNADSTIGVVLNWLFTKLTDKFFLSHRETLGWLKSGDYGNPPKCSAFWAQLFVWSTIITVSKVITFGFVVLLAKPLNAITKFIFSPFNLFPNVRALIIMGIYPIIVSCLVFLVQDSIMMNHQPQQQARQGGRLRDDEDINDVTVGVPPRGRGGGGNGDSGMETALAHYNSSLLSSHPAQTHVPVLDDDGALDDADSARLISSQR